nr:hypothetical protein [Tanacetum cinerariifolium]
MKNKVEAQPRKVNKKNRVVEHIRDDNVKRSLLNANSIYATCKKSMFDGVHNMCLLDFVKNVNSRAKSAKKHKKNIWKPTGHVFTEVGLKWKLIGRTFTIVDQFDSIKKIRVRTKEQSDPLINKLNFKSVKNENSKSQIQDKVFVITSLRNNLLKIKGKEIIDIAAQKPFTNTIIPSIFKLNIEPLAPRLFQNRDIQIE